MVSKFEQYKAIMLQYCSNEVLDLFEKFLKRMKVFDAFEANLNIRENMIIQGPHLLTANAFVWMSSPELFNFWWDIDDKWVTYLLKHGPKE